MLLVWTWQLASAAAQSKSAPSDPETQTYADSAQGLQAQFEEILRVGRSKDQVAVHALLESLAIPHADIWFVTHFDSRFASQLQTDYQNALAKYQSHVSWVVVNFGKFDDFAITVQPSELPAPLRDSGFESLLPGPASEVKVENYRLSSAAPDPKHGPPSWVSSFVYVDGRFRYVGGTYPFWTEGLNAFRGPMSMAPAVINGRSVQGIAYRKDQPGAGIDAVVQLKIEIAHDGRVRHIKVLSGDPAFVKDAEDYVKQAEFGALPDIPQFANAKREWEMEVAFFTPHK